jgi:RNase P subunit RPR2
MPHTHADDMPDSPALGAPEDGSMRASVCPHCQSTDVRLTSTDLHADPQRHDLQYRLRCYGCGFQRRWQATEARAVAHWPRLRRRRRTRKTGDFVTD